MGTGGGGVEASAAHADGNAVLHGPRHRACVVAISVLPVLIEGLLELLTPQNPPLCIGGWATLSQPSVNSHTAAQLQYAAHTSDIGRICDTGHEKVHCGERKRFLYLLPKKTAGGVLTIKV